MQNEKQTGRSTLYHLNLNLEDKMTAINCSVCEKPIEGYTVYNAEMEPMHPGCAPAEFKEQAKAERKAAKKDHVGVRLQRKIDSLWNKRGRATKRADKLEVELKKERAALAEIDVDLLATDPKFAEKLIEAEQSGSEGEVLA